VVAGGKRQGERVGREESGRDRAEERDIHWGSETDEE